MQDAVRSLLEDSGGRPPSPQRWAHLLVALGIAPRSAEQIPVRLGTVVQGGTFDASAVAEQLDVWAAGLRLRGETADADVLAEAAATAMGAAAPGVGADAGAPPDRPRRTPPRESDGPGQPDDADEPPDGRDAVDPAAGGPAAGARRPGPRPPSPPPGRRGGPTATRGSGAQPPRRGDAPRPQAPQHPPGAGTGRPGPPRPAPGPGLSSPRPAGPGPAGPRPAGPRPTGPGPAGPGPAGHGPAGPADPPERRGADQAPEPAWDPSPFDDLPTASKVVLAVLSVMFLACLVALAFTVAG